MERKDRLNFFKSLSKTNHETFCSHNHEDYCGWYYEIDKENPDWTNFSLYNFLEKTIKVSNKHGFLGLRHALAKLVEPNRVEVNGKIYTAALDIRGNRESLHKNTRIGDKSLIVLAAARKEHKRYI